MGSQYEMILNETYYGTERQSVTECEKKMVNRIRSNDHGLARYMALAWRSGSVMDCHATARDAIPGGNGVKKRASRPSQGTVNGVPSLNDLAVAGT